MTNKETKVEEITTMSEDKAMVRAKGESLLKNLDIIDIITNVEETITGIANKYEVDSDVLLNWFWSQMPIQYDE